MLPESALFKGLFMNSEPISLKLANHQKFFVHFSGQLADLFGLLEKRDMSRHMSGLFAVQFKTK